MVEEENAMLTSPQQHIKITTIQGTTLTEIDLKTSRIAILQTRQQRKIHMESGRGSRDWTQLGTTFLAGDPEEEGENITGSGVLLEEPEV